MDKSWMKIVHRTKDERFRLGLDEFLTFAYRNKDESSKIPCPCRKCNNFQSHGRDDVFVHVMNFGMSVNYHRWIYHGESSVDISNDLNYNDDEDDSDLYNMLNDIGQSNWGENWQTRDGLHNTHGIHVDKLRRLFDDNQQKLYDGCKNFTKFSFTVTLLHLKTSSGWTAKSFDALLDVLKKALPITASIPKNFYEAKKYIRDLGFAGEKIHACINNCVLFRKEYASLTNCVKCGVSRYKGDGSNIPVKVLRYFPLIPRLQRLFINESVARDMRWHKENRKDGGNVIRHPADSEAWKHLDRQFPSFSIDPRSVRLGLATDGFNPFGHLSNAYSIWPVFLMPYNLPPWKCMKDPFFFMSMLIPGPNSPGKKIDVYLQPLIDELNDLWIGVEAYDAHKREKFCLRAALLWTINDFPAYSMLSGRTVKGYKACPICMDATSSKSLPHSHKICYMGHRRFLPTSHPWRLDKKNFDGNVEHREAIIPKSGQEILDELFSIFGDLNEFDDVLASDKGKKRKRRTKQGGTQGCRRGSKQGAKQGGTKNLAWHKRSVFFKLPYWVELKLRHNLDIMHVIKNVTESIVATIFDIKSKTKDTWKSRKDLMDEGLKKSLHLQSHNDSFIMPMASYHLTKDEKDKILNFMESLKFPDGFVSNMARCIKDNDFQISGMKSHDFYVFIQRVLPLAIRGSLTKEVRQVLYELSEFIQNVCSRNSYIDVLKTEEDKIALILCKLERLFPPSLFDIMVHLLIHLPREAILAGPPQYRWMFPVERKMGTLKSYVNNKARPEGCIAERYLDNECLTFCSMYMHDVDTIFNTVERNNERAEANGEIYVFSSKARPLGKSNYCNLDEIELSRIQAYILNNSRDRHIDDLIEEHKLQLEEEAFENVEQSHNEKFPSWFKDKVLSSPQSYQDEIRILARGPLRRVSRYTGCMVNGYKFHTQSRENNRKTQNSGVVVEGEHGHNTMDFYGLLQDILELEYLGCNKRVLVFKCDWYFLGDRTGVQQDKESRFISVNISKKWYKEQPYVLASEVKQVFYALDMKLGTNWRVVQTVTPRALYDVIELDETNEITQIEEVYQEQNPNISHISYVSTQMDLSLSRGATPLLEVDATIVNESGKRTSKKKKTKNDVDDSFIDDEDKEIEDEDDDEDDEGEDDDQDEIEYEDEEDELEIDEEEKE